MIVVKNVYDDADDANFKFWGLWLCTEQLCTVSIQSPL